MEERELHVAAVHDVVAPRHAVVAVRDREIRPRLRGRTSLTPIRLVSAAARVLLAMLVVPLRDRIRVLAGD